VVEGSGAALPPVAADRTVCATSVPRLVPDALSYLGPVRLLRSQLLVVFGAGGLSAARREELATDLAQWMPRDSIAFCELEPEPAEEVPPGATVACFTTAGRSRAGPAGRSRGAAEPVPGRTTWPGGDLERMSRALTPVEGSDRAEGGCGGRRRARPGGGCAARSRATGRWRTASRPTSASCTWSTWGAGR
jgi:hypothetical protein